jgi:hypothetical protein
MTIPASSTGAPRCVTPRMHTRKEKASNRLKDKGRECAVLTPGGLTQGAIPAGCFPRQNQVEDESSDESPSDLRHPISQQLLECHSSCGKDPKAHRRVDVTPRDLPDAIGHGDDAKTESKRGSRLR